MDRISVSIEGKEREFEKVSSRIFKSRLEEGENSVYLKFKRKEHKELQKYFDNEKSILTEINSPHVISLVGHFEDENTEAIFLEDFNGVSLDKLNIPNSLGLRAKLSLFHKMLVAVQEIHSQSVIHLSLKSSNFVWNEEQGELKIIDFETAFWGHKEIPRNFLSNGSNSGWSYQSPEQIGSLNRNIDSRSDIYSLGICFYELMYGNSPYQAKNLRDFVHLHLSKDLYFPETICPFEKKLQEIISRMCEKNPDSRYQRCTGVLYDIQQLLTAEKTSRMGYFCLGLKDRPLYLSIPDRFYGRQEHRKTIFEGLDNLSRSSKEFYLIAGESGVGKTFLVNEVLTQAKRRDLIVLVDKVDQILGDSLGNALLNLINGFIDYLLFCSEEIVDKWKAIFRQELGVNAKVLTDVLPSLKLMLGDQPKPAELDPVESKKRFDLLLIKILRSFRHSNLPVVMFLDDLQWAGDHSIQLLEKIKADSEIKNLFFVGAYRNMEVKEGSILKKLELDCRKTHLIELKPLNRVDIRTLLVDCLGNIEGIERLEETILEKTGGNPFELHELLKLFERKSYLFFDNDKMVWCWNWHEASKSDISENVVNRLVEQMRELDVFSQEVLSHGAAIGNTFSVPTLSHILGCSSGKVEDSLLRLLKSQFVRNLESGRGDFQFCHDKIQEAAYKIIEEDALPKLHYKIGSHLLELIKAGNTYHMDDIVVASHWNRSLELLNSQEKTVLLKLNKVASERARASASFSESLEWIRQALRVEASENFEAANETKFEILLEQVSLLYLNGKLKECESLAIDLLSKTHDCSQKVALYNKLVIQYTAEGRYKEAIEKGILALNILGEDLNSTPTDAQVVEEIFSVSKLLEEQDLDELPQKDTLKDESKQQAMNILINLDSPCYLSNIDLYCMVVMRMIRISVLHGLVPESAKAFASYGIVLSAYDEFKKAYRFTEIGIAISERFQHLGQMCRANHTMANHVLFWSEEISQSHKFNDRGFQTGQAAGEYLWAGFIRLFKPHNLFFGGMNLKELNDEISYGIKYCQEHPNQVGLDTLTGLQLICEKFQRSENTDWLIRRDEFAKKCRENGSLMALSIFLSVESFSKVLFGDFENLAEVLEESKNLKPYSFSVVTNVYDYFVESLLLLKFLGNENNKASWEKVELNQKKLSMWAENCPSNFASLFLLVEAERFYVESKVYQAIDLYSEAQKIADRNHFSHLAAFCNEKLANCWESLGNFELTNYYLKKAAQVYRYWGADEKCKLVEEKIKSFEPEPNLCDIELSPIELGVDIYTILEAYQVLGKQMFKEDLIETMLNLLIRCAGATAGSIHLLDSDTQKLRLQTNIHISGKKIKIPEALVHYVWRTSRDWNSKDIEKNSPVNLPEFQFNNDISRACFLIPNLGVVYLENELDSLGFSSERLRLVSLMIHQLKVSLDNFAMYDRLNQFNEELERKVAERTKDLLYAKEKAESYSNALRRTQAELLETARVAGRADVVLNVLHNVGNAATLLVGLLENLESHIENDGPQEFLQILSHKFSDPQAFINMQQEEGFEEDLVGIFSDLLHISTDSKGKALSSISAIKEKIDLVIKLILAERNSTTNLKLSYQVSLRELIDEAVKMVDAKDICEQIYEIESEDLIYIDMAKVKNIIINLLENSVRACRGLKRKPKIFITTKLSHGVLEIEVLDNGIGIDEESLKRIFDPGFSTKNHLGAGYGLHSSSNISMQLGGNLTAASDGADMGASFVLTIPLPGNTTQP